jgi:hypothetical protein
VERLIRKERSAPEIAQGIAIPRSARARLKPLDFFGRDEETISPAALDLIAG